MAKKGLNIYRRKDGRFEGRYSVIDEITGEKKYQSVYGETYQKTRNKLMSAISANVKPPQKSNMTVKEISTEWLNAIKSQIKTSTYANYLNKLEKQIFPTLGNIRYDKLTTTQLNDFVNYKLNNGRLKDNSGLSNGYVRDIAIMLKSIGKFTAKTYNLHNPCAEISMPKVSRKTFILFSKVEEASLVEFLMDNLTLSALGILIAMFTGMRLGELCALKWSDIDFSKHTIRINKTVQRVREIGNKFKKTKLIITSPKSETSIRDIPITDFLFEVLRKFRADGDFYVLNGKSNIPDPRTIQYQFKRILQNANLPSVKFHSLRHVFATKCVQTVGFDIKTLSEILGHTTVETTLRMYVHSSEERKRECMNLLN
ncbi:transposase [Clostridia bacterium]|nr:transposase [Clostridia bacterium]